MPEQRHICSATFKYSRELFRRFRRDNRVYSARRDEHSKSAEVTRKCWLERDHWTEKDACCFIVRVKEHETRGNIRSIRITNENEALLTESILLCSGIDEMR